MQITPALLSAILNIAGPPVLAFVTAHHAATGQMPTLDELKAELNSNIDKYLAEGAAFTAAHPHAGPT